MHWPRYELYIDLLYKQVPRFMAYLRHVVNNNVDARFMLQVLWDLWRYRYQFLLVCGEEKVIKNHDSQCNMEVNMSDFVVSTVPCDGVAPLGTRTSADIGITIKCVSRMYVGTIACQVRFFNAVLSPYNTISFLQITHNQIPLNLTHRIWFGVSVMSLTPTQLETHGFVFSNVATDALVFKHPDISIHCADLRILCMEQFHTKRLQL